MKVIQVTAKIFSDIEKPVSGKTVGVEVYNLLQNSWQVIGQARTNAAGLVSAKIRFLKTIDVAPNLRLIEVDSAPPRILSQTAYLNYDSRSERLLCDFGEIEQLEETSYSSTATQPEFKSDKSILSGQAKRPGVSTPSMIRALDTINLTGRATLTGITEGVTALPLRGAVAGSLTLDTYNAELIRFQSEKSVLMDKITLSDVKLKKTSDELSTSRIELDKTRAEVSTLKVSLDQAKVARAELDSSREEITSLKINLDKLAASEQVLKERNEVFTQEEKRLSPIETIASNIGEQIDSANKKMKLEVRPYQIHNIALELNGSLSQDGKSIALTRMVDSKDGIKGSQTLKMDLVSTALSSSSVEATVPDITGLTESLVKRLMKSLGLNIEGMQKSVGPSSAYTIGQAISQSPAAGAKLPLNGVVLVVFAAE